MTGSSPSGGPTDLPPLQGLDHWSGPFVRIKSPNAPRVTGSIKVTMNRHKVRTDRLSRLDHGRVVLRLPKRRPGIYRVVVSYAGSNAVKRSHSQVDVLRVLRNARQPRSLPFNVW